MQNLTKLKEAALIADAKLHLGGIEDAKAAMAEMLNEIAALDAVWLAMALAGDGEPRPVRPNYDTTPIDARRYSTGRTLHKLGIKPDHVSMKRLYETVKPHRDLIEAMRRYNHSLDSGEPVAGPPPLEPLAGAPGLCAISPRKLLEREHQTPAQARAHAVKAAAERLKANCDVVTGHTGVCSA